MHELNDTAHKILDVAERYTQINGFNAFSYKDLQNEVGVKTSSIHYYFPTKQHLALSMTERYSESFADILETITQKNEHGLKRLQALGELYTNTVRQGKFCMCGMLASDMLSLSEVVNSKLCEFFQLIENWIAAAIELAKQQKHIKNSVNSESAASHFLAALEGGMLLARTQKRPEYLEVIVSQALTQLKI